VFAGPAPALTPETDEAAPERAETAVFDAFASETAACEWVSVARSDSRWLQASNDSAKVATTHETQTRARSAMNVH
jgi:hypothetical protein